MHTTNELMLLFPRSITPEVSFLEALTGIVEISKFRISKSNFSLGRQATGPSTQHSGCFAVSLSNIYQFWVRDAQIKAERPNIESTNSFVLKDICFNDKNRHDKYLPLSQNQHLKEIFQNK